MVMSKETANIYIQTWHGIPLKKMGFDESSMIFATDEEMDNLKRKVDYGDSPHSTEWKFQKDVCSCVPVQRRYLAAGIPSERVTGETQIKILGMERELGLDEHRRTVLYAPTFREAGGAALELDLERFVER